MENNFNSDSLSNTTDVNPENLVAEVRAELTEIDSMDVSDHADRFEQLNGAELGIEYESNIHTFGELLEDAAAEGGLASADFAG